jgi:photosystem II stability/assembly factor-like uncharacterized protein
MSAMSLKLGLLAAAGLLALADTASAAATAPSPAFAPSPALYDGLAWRLVGPHRAGWATMIEGVPSRPDTFYFGAAGGGVWKSQDAGRTWASVFDKGPAAIGALAVAPSDPDVVYVGTGHPEPRYDVQAGEGVFRSGDGGKTWSDLGLASTGHVGRIWIDPANPDHVLVGAVGHLFGPNAERGVFASTDGGKSWAHTLKIDDKTGVVDLAGDPADPKTIYAVAWQARVWPWLSYFTPVAGPGSGLYRSSDGGATWTRLDGEGWPKGDLGRIGLAVTRTSAGVRLYAAVESPTEGGLWRSDDGGGHWRRVNEEKAFTGWYNARLTVDPHDPDVVYTVGQSIRRCDQGGERCEIVKGAPGGDDYHFVWINPAHPERMATASDQGAVVSVDGGASWSSWYNQPTGQFYHLAADDQYPFRIYSGQQDSGTVSIASRSDFGGITFRDWRPVGGDERDYDIPDPNDPQIVYASGLGGRVMRFDTVTGQSADISPWPVGNYGQRPTTTRHHFVWVTPLVASRTGPATLYLGGEVVFSSQDQGRTWRIISPDLTGKRADAQRCGGDVAVADAMACGYGGIFSIAPSPRNAKELWVGTDDGLIQLTRDGGAHWSNVTPPGLPAWAKVSSLDVSAIEDGTAYAAVDNHRQDDFTPRAFVTHDYGATWRAAAEGLPAGHYVSVVRADPVKAGLLYAGTDQGVYVSLDDGRRWLSLQQNLPNALANDLLVHGDDLVVATQGRAIWTLDDVTPLRQLSAETAKAPAHLFAPAVAVRTRYNNNHDTPLPPETPMGANPPQGAVIDYWLDAPAKGEVVLEIRDAKGGLVQRMTSAAAPARPDAQRYFAKTWERPQAALAHDRGMHRVVWNLRQERPRAISYGYSIAAIAGQDTPITPLGAYAVPGDYQVVLKVDGREQHAALKLVEDPRVHVSADDLQASADVSREIAEDLALGARSYGEISAAHVQLADLSKAIKGGGKGAALASRVTALAAKTDPAVAGARFVAADASLTSLEDALEGADAAPTEALRQTRMDTSNALRAAAAEWASTRDGELKALNLDLARAGLKPVVLTAANTMVVAPADGGEDMP